MLSSVFSVSMSESDDGVCWASMFFFKNETVNCWKKLKDIALGLIIMIKKSLTKIINFLPSGHQRLGVPIYLINLAF